MVVVGRLFIFDSGAYRRKRSRAAVGSAVAPRGRLVGVATGRLRASRNRPERVGFAVDFQASAVELPQCE